MLKALSPLDGRYAHTTHVLSKYFSEYALIRYRIYVEVQYLKALINLPIPQLKNAPEDTILRLDSIFSAFDESAAGKVRNRDEEGGELLFYIISLRQLFDFKIINK